ncbi:AcrR family transcriptional regulator [Aurantimonas endophytica]|uniref:AcrR family transcriptional regulator n=1 Tax=Aurantimonas endophytica TaxID=1522175 RepID=A0A7W6MMV2_9HYPH|nr:AcrR family transcriptional regulator [Aurantimonas endophytica]MCO6403133.1 TetR family transcriptional regulator [Aurantimonas endophytica]
MGRQRTFDVEEVLEAALRVFWRKGYEGASYADLVEAAGVERPALYSAFGNKEALFFKALARYDERYLDYFPEALALPTAREVTSHHLHSALELNTRFPDRTGCMGINGAVAGSDETEPVRRALAEFRAAGQERLRDRFERAKAEGDLPDSANPGSLAAFVMTMAQGIAIQAKAGASRETLEEVIEQALASWPVADDLPTGGALAREPEGFGQDAALGGATGKPGTARKARTHKSAGESVLDPLSQAEKPGRRNARAPN